MRWSLLTTEVIIRFQNATQPIAQRTFSSLTEKERSDIRCKHANRSHLSGTAVYHITYCPGSTGHSYCKHISADHHICCRCFRHLMNSIDVHLESSEILCEQMFSCIHMNTCIAVPPAIHTGSFPLTSVVIPGTV